MLGKQSTQVEQSYFKSVFLAISVHLWICLKASEEKNNEKKEKWFRKNYLLLIILVKVGVLLLKTKAIF